MKKTSEKIQFIVTSAVIAALYTVLTLFTTLTVGGVQIRISEILTILPIFLPSSIPGLTVGCFLSNLLLTANPYDMIFGTLATLIGAAFAYLLRKHKYFATIPTVIANVIFVPLATVWGLKMEMRTLPVLILGVFITELISVIVLGDLAILTLEKRKIHFNK